MKKKEEKKLSNLEKKKKRGDTKMGYPRKGLKERKKKKEKNGNPM